MSILLADDDLDLARFLSKSLESEGYQVHTAPDENAVFAELQRQNYKLIILDLNFGKTDGLMLLEKLRAEGVSTPVIVLSARNKVSDRIQSFNLGADDYVTKPFSFQELAARANALLRRKADPSLNILRVEDLELDPATRRVTRAGREIRLSAKEFHLLQMLMQHAGSEVTRQDLLREIWGSQSDSDSNLVDVYVNYLRRKIEHFVTDKAEERIDDESKLIHTVRGVGYRIGRAAHVSMSAFDGAHPTLELLSAHKTGFPAGAVLSRHEASSVPQTPWKALVNSVAHELAQPLTSIRCFLEVAAVRKGSVFASPSDFKSIEQQVDRAIVLAKTISALVREIPVPAAPWVSLNHLLEQIFDDSAASIQSGLLTVERRWDNSIHVTSSPVLQQLVLLLVGKLTGKNTKPITLTVSGMIKESRCHLELRWRGLEPGSVQGAETVLGADFVYVQEMAYSIGAEIVLVAQTGICLKLPAALQLSPLSPQRSLTP